MDFILEINIVFYYEKLLSRGGIDLVFIEKILYWLFFRFIIIVLELEKMVRKLSYFRYRIICEFGGCL